MRSSFLPITRFPADVLPNYSGMPPLKTSQRLYRLLSSSAYTFPVAKVRPRRRDSCSLVSAGHSSGGMLSRRAN